MYSLSLTIVFHWSVGIDFLYVCLWHIHIIKSLSSGCVDNMSNSSTIHNVTVLHEKHVHSTLPKQEFEETHSINPFQTNITYTECPALSTCMLACLVMCELVRSVIYNTGNYSMSCQLVLPIFQALAEYLYFPSVLGL